MKSYTDLKQSKKLAEILPLESADMCWTNHCYGAIRSSMTISAKTVDEYKSLLDRFNDSASIDVFYPAWSLAALLDVLKDNIKIEKTQLDQSDIFTYSIVGDGYNYRTYEHDELIDACVEMIVKLHELKMLCL